MQKTLEEILDELVTETHNRVLREDSFDVAVLWPIAQAKEAIESLIKQAEIKARIDELQWIPIKYGHRSVETYADHHTSTVAERYVLLQDQLKEIS